MVARLNGIQEVRGSNPLSSTTWNRGLTRGSFLFAQARSWDYRQNETVRKGNLLRLAYKATRKRQVCKEKVITVSDLTDKRFVAIKIATWLGKEITIKTNQ